MADNNSLFNRLLTMYQDEKLGQNSICRECQLENENGFSKPASPWHIGNRFQEDNYKILFVGKNARGGDSYKKKTSYAIQDMSAEGREYYFNYGAAFWSYTREITSRLYGVNDETAFNRIAITNLVKCNNAMYGDGKNVDDTDSDYTTDTMKKNCLIRMGVFWKEVNILKPKNIIIYSHYYYDDYLQTIPPQYTIKEITTRETTRSVGQKEIYWWNTELYIGNKLAYRLLRTSHPERKNKESFVELLIQWITGNTKGDES